MFLLRVVVLVLFFDNVVTATTQSKHLTSNASQLLIFKKLISKPLPAVSTLTEDDGDRFLELISGLKNRQPPQLNSTMLRRRLGEDFEPEFMSETQPNWAWLKMKNALEKRVEFEAFKHGKEADNRILKFFEQEQIVLNGVQFEDVRLWLWNMTRCTVEPFWKDLGVNVWPRFVNFGKCSNKTTCSIPKGMKCKVGEQKTIRLMFWLCLRNWSIPECVWSKLQMNVIRSCRCSC